MGLETLMQTLESHDTRIHRGWGYGCHITPRRPSGRHNGGREDPQCSTLPVANSVRRQCLCGNQTTTQLN